MQIKSLRSFELSWYGITLLLWVPLAVPGILVGLWADRLEKKEAAEREARWARERAERVG